MLRFYWVSFDRFKVVNLSRSKRVNLNRPYWVCLTVFSTPVHIWVFAAALLIVLSITLLTVTLQSYKAATENPANAVKSE